MENEVRLAENKSVQVNRSKLDQVLAELAIFSLLLWPRPDRSILPLAIHIVID
jgi:hypothetical protein